MATVHREVEYKFDVVEDAVIPSLDGLEGVARVEGPVTQELTADYFDTDDRALSRAGIRLRRRTGGDDPGWHLKLPRGSHTRTEVKFPLGRAVHTVPKALRESVELFTRGAELHREMELRTQRHVLRLLDAADLVLLEVSDDFRAETPIAASLGGGENAWTTVTRGWEAELVDGSVDQLRAAAKLLADAGGQRVALPAADAPTAGDLDDSTAGAVVLARLREQVDAIRYTDPLVRLDLDDAVHSMRVAMRRLRSALTTFRPLFDRSRTDPIRDELKWIAAVLGEARDAEVMTDRLRALVDQQPAEAVVGPVKSRIDTELGQQYHDGHQQSVAAMSQERYFTLIDRLDELVAHPPWQEDASRQDAGEVLPGLVKHEFKRMRKRVAHAHAADDDATRNERLHEVRKAAKRTRYAAETLIDSQGRPAKRFAKAAKKVQSVLGDQHDAAVTQAALLDLAASAAEAGENAFTYGRLHAAEEAAAAELTEQFETTWQWASGKRLRRWLK